MKKTDKGEQYITGKFIKGTLWNTIGVSTYFGCQWLITILAVWLFDDFSSVGYLALAMSITNFFFIIASYNIRIFQASDTKDEFGNDVYIASRILTCAAAFVLCWIFALAAGLTAFQQAIVLAFMLYRVNEAFLDVFHGINQKQWRMDIIGVSMAARGVASVAVFTLLGWMSGILWAVVGIFIITVFIGAVYDFQKTKQLAALSLCFDTRIVQLVKKCFPLMIVVLISTFTLSYSRFSVDRIHGTEAFGVFSAVTAPAMIIQIAATVVLAPLANVFASYFSGTKIKEFAKVFVLYGAIMALFVFFAYVFALAAGEWGLGLLYGAQILPYAYLLPSAVIVAGTTAFMWYMSVVYTVIRDIRGLLYGNIMAAAICLAITDVFLIEIGLIGANYIVIVCQGVAVFFFFIRLLWFIKRKKVEAMPTS